MAVARMRDETLAWLAVHDRLERHSKRLPSGILMRIFGGRSRAGARNAVSQLRIRSANRLGMEPPKPDFENLIPKPVSRNMVLYSLAVDELTKRLTDSERAALRADQVVPDWFIPAVYKTARKI